MSKKSNKKPVGIVAGDVVCVAGGEGNTELIGGEWTVLSVDGDTLNCVHTERSNDTRPFYRGDVYKV